MGERERETKPTCTQVFWLHICRKGAHLMEKAHQNMVKDEAMKRQIESVREKHKSKTEL